MHNAMAYVPRLAMRSQVAADLKAVFDAPDRPEAERQLALVAAALRGAGAAAGRVDGSEHARGPDGVRAARRHRRRLRTSNMLERLNEEIKRRTRVAGLFPNEASALRLVSAVLMEISEEWETNRKYLTMGSD